MNRGFGRHDVIVGLVVTLNSVFGMVPKIIFADWMGTFLAFLYPRLSVNKTFKSASGYRVVLLIAAFLKNTPEVSILQLAAT